MARKRRAPCSKKDVSASKKTATVSPKTIEPAVPGEKNLELLISSLQTLTYGLSVSFEKTSWGSWIRHPLSIDDLCHKIGVEINSDRIKVSCAWRRSCHGVLSGPNTNDVPEISTEPGFIWIINFRIFVVDENKAILSQSFDSFFMKPNTYQSCLSSLFYNVKKRFPDGSKKFFVSFTLSEFKDGEIYRAVQKEQQPLLPSTSQAQVSVPFINKHLWEKKENTDLVVVPMGGKEINVHKCFLMGSSPVFQAMFTHDTVEKQTGRWVVEDVPHNIISEMLQFVYLETVSATDVKELIEILGVANRYDMARLITAVEDILVAKLFTDKTWGKIVLPVAHKLNLKNLKSASEEAIMKCTYGTHVADFLLATDCSAERLQRLAAAYIVTQRTPPTLDSDWKKLESAYPELARFVHISYVNFLQNKTCEAEIVAP